ncbi:hypothetical protein A3Q56_08685, partial [Intoshia linei]
MNRTVLKRNIQGDRMLVITKSNLNAELRYNLQMHNLERRKMVKKMNSFINSINAISSCLTYKQHEQIRKIVEKKKVKRKMTKRQEKDLKYTFNLSVKPMSSYHRKKNYTNLNQN